MRVGAGAEAGSGAFDGAGDALGEDAQGDLGGYGCSASEGGPGENGPGEGGRSDPWAEVAEAASPDGPDEDGVGAPRDGMDTETEPSMGTGMEPCTSEGAAGASTNEVGSSESSRRAPRPSHAPWLGSNKGACATSANCSIKT
jgi:hypothetical protein